MAYTKTTWVDGTTKINATNMNHIEGGIKDNEDALATHTHGSITRDGKIGGTAGLPVFTGADGAVGTKTVADAKTALGIPTFSYSSGTLTITTT